MYLEKNGDVGINLSFIQSLTVVFLYDLNMTGCYKKYYALSNI